jgi:HEAT repeat protein
VKPGRRWLLLGCATLLLASSGVLWWLGRSSNESPAPIPRSAALPPNAPPVDLQWRVGSSQQYQVRTDSSFRINTAAGGAAQAMRVRMHCVLDMLTLEAGPEAALVGMRLSSIELQVGGNSDPDTNRALAVPFRVRFVSGGLPEAFEFPAGVTAQHRAMLENVVRMFQVTMHKGEAWVAQESNASGAYEAAYRRTAPARVEKIKRHFVGFPSAPMLAGAEIASKEAFRIDARRDWIQTMRVDETLQTKGRLAIEIKNHATLELRPTAHAAATSDTWNFVAAAAPAVAEATKPPISNLSREDAHRQLVAEVHALDAAREGRTAWIHRLRDLLRVDAALPDALLEVMKTQELTDRTRADLYLAFELAGTVPAQAALASVVADTTWSKRDALRAIVALGGVAHPSRDTLATLWDAVQSAPSSGDRRQLASTATFALGSLGHAMQAAKDPDYASLRARLLSGALSGTDARQRANFAYAVGNTRDTSLARDIAPLLDDGSPAVRRAAAESLGMLGTNQVADQLMSRLNQERNSAVRSAIAESLVTWTAPSASAVASIGAAVRSEPDENTRFNMARFLGANLARFPQNRAVLQDLLRTEQSKRIRQSVAEALAAPG